MTPHVRVWMCEAGHAVAKSTSDKADPRVSAHCSNCGARVHVLIEPAKARTGTGVL